MKTKFCLFTALLLAASSLQAALLTATTAVHVQPDETAPVVSYLKAGTNAAASANAKAAAPAGWMAVDINTPFEAYVANRDINKSLDPRPGSALRAQAKLEAPVLATMEAGDKVEITGLKGKWTQVKVTKNLVGFIKVSAVSTAAPIPAPLASAPAPKPAPVTAPVAQAPVSSPEPRGNSLPANDPSPLSAAPVAPVAWGNAPTGQPVPVSMGDGGSASLPRSYAGKFVSSRRPFAPKRPYDFQINDDAGIRFAYLDLSKLMLTDSLEKYLDRPVSVYGTARNMPGTRDIVIEVENMQLK